MKKSQIDISLISQVVLSVLVIIMGIVIMIFKSFGLLDMILYTSILFFIFSFFSIPPYTLVANSVCEGWKNLILSIFLA